jgi:calmodulin
MAAPKKPVAAPAAPREDVALAPVGNKAIFEKNIRELHLCDPHDSKWERPAGDNKKWLTAYFSNDYYGAPTPSWAPARGVRIGVDKTGYFINESHMRRYCGLPKSCLGAKGANAPDKPPNTHKETELTEISGMDAWREKVILSIFKGADKDGNGTVDSNELGLMLRRLVPKIGREEVKGIMKAFDEDESGALNVTEFTTWLRTGASPETKEALNKSLRNEQEALRASFRMLDKDGSGTLDKSELWGLLSKTCPNVSEEMLDKFFATIDRDGSGEVDYHEFVNAVFET